MIRGGIGGLRTLFLVLLDTISSIIIIRWVPIFTEVLALMEI
jgi:hypothetical protein